LAKHINGTATEYMQDVAADLPVVLQETTGADGNVYIYGNDLTTRFDASGNPAYYHHDALGSVRAMSNNGGQRTDAYQYATFGGVREHSGSATQPFQFTGEPTDPSTSLIYLRARYYDPQLGRFISPDFFPGFATDPQSANPYPYTQNNPIIYTDPEGEAVVTLLALGVLAYGGYKTVDAWKDFLDNAEQMEENLSGYYEFDFEDPEWQEKYGDYNPGEDVAITARSAGYAALNTPGTSLTGQPPTSLDWTIPTSFALEELLLPDFEKPSPNRIQPIRGRDQTSEKNGSVLGFWNRGTSSSDVYAGTWGGPPSSGK
jgi:RHS repeat-associated protein